LEGSYDCFDVNKDHNLGASEFAAAQQAATAADADHRFVEFVEFVGANETLPLQRNQVRVISRKMTAKWCENLSDCTVAYDQSRLFTDVFPVAEAIRFVNEHDTNADGMLARSEFPGVPEPETHLLGTDDQGR